MPAGRFAPTPSADLHLGNLRTALLAWLFARSTGSRFVIRVDDLDPASSSPVVAGRQLDDLGLMGIEWDDVEWQHEHHGRHAAAIAGLVEAGLTYPCYCTRREVLEAATAPHGPGPEGAYPGTCRDLTDTERDEREAAGRPASLRLRAAGAESVIQDRLHGSVRAVVDDFVLRRSDGVTAYNLAVVTDDAAQGVEEVVRGDDLLLSAPRQAHLARLLGLAVPTYAHVPLVIGPNGERLSKRAATVSVAEGPSGGQSVGHAVGQVRSWLATSIGLAEAGEEVTMHDLVDRFDPDHLAVERWSSVSAP